MTDPYPPGSRREEAALGTGPAGPGTVPEFLHPAGLAPGAASGQASRRYRVPADPGCYEIRFRLAGPNAWGLSYVLLMIALGAFQARSSLYEWVIMAAFGGLFALGHLIPLARRRVAFRAGPAGVTLGRLGNFGFSYSTVLIPWTDIKKIALYELIRSSRKFGQKGPYMAIVPHGAPPGKARRIDAWRLDDARLAAVAAVAAPGVPVAHVGGVDPRDDAGQAFLRDVARWP